MEQPPQQPQVVYVYVPVFVNTPPPPPPGQPQPQNPQAPDPGPDPGPTPNLTRPLVFRRRRWVAGRRAGKTYSKANGAARELIRKDNWRVPNTIPDVPNWSTKWWKFQGLKWRHRTCNGIKWLCNEINEHKIELFMSKQIIRFALSLFGLFGNLQWLLSWLFHLPA